MTIEAVTDAHTEALVEFMTGLPEADRTFIQEDVGNADEVRRLISARVSQWVMVDDDGRIEGYVAVRSRPGWSDHVGDIRLVVGKDSRRGGVGKALARHAVMQTIADGRRKVVVELPADQGHAVAMFSELGFTGEALLRDHIRDRHGDLRDLLVLAHFVDDNWSGMETIGLAEEMGAQ